MRSLTRQEKIHEPVLVSEVLESLYFKNGVSRLRDRSPSFIDATVGTGGLSLEIVKKGGKVLAIDADDEMLAVASQRLKEVGGDYKLAHGNFRNIDKIAEANGFAKVDGIVFDLGVSNPQLTSPSRGFSFGNPEAILDMRIDPTSQGVMAADLLNALRPEQLLEMFSAVLSWKEAKFLTNLVVKKRERRPFKTVGDFLEIAERLKGKPGLNPATLAFLALRIAVNSELVNLSEALPKAFSLLRNGGKLCLITFHSGEEKLVVRFFAEKEREGKAQVLTPKPTVANSDEVNRNPRARSAHLRVLEKKI